MAILQKESKRFKYFLTLQNDNFNMGNNWTRNFKITNPAGSLQGIPETRYDGLLFTLRLTPGTPSAWRVARFF
jgi:hypothetical protein